MKIMKTINKIPAGLTIVPLFMRVLTNTLCPRVLQTGSFTTATFSNTGMTSFIGVQLFGIGTMLKFRDIPRILKRGGVLLLSKFLAGVVIDLTTNTIFGDKGLFGLTALALISAIINSSGSVCTTLVTTYGGETGCAAVSILTFSDGPFLTLVVSGTSGLADIPLISLVAMLVPLVVGMILGNLDEDCNKFFTPLVGLMVPFVGLTLGGSISLVNTVKGELPDVILGLLAMYIAGPFTTFCDRKISKHSGYVGLTVSAIAGNSTTAPAAVALIDPAWQPYVAEATTQITAAVVVTAIVIPIATSTWIKRFGSPKDPVSGHAGEIQ